MPPFLTGLGKRSHEDDSDSESAYESSDSALSEQPRPAKRHDASGAQLHKEGPQVDSVVLSELNNGRVRTVKMDGRWYFCVRDVIMVVCDMNNKRASEALVNIKGKSDHSDFFGMVRNFQFPGVSERQQPVATFDDIQKLIMVLPGKSAKKYRTMVVETFKRYLAGDEALVDEIRENAASSNPMNVFAREDLEADRAQRAKVSDMAYRKELAEVEKMERENEVLARENERGNYEMMLVYEKQLSDHVAQDTDPTVRRMNLDFYKNMVKGKQMQLAHTSKAIMPPAGDADAPPPRLRVPISDIYQAIAKRRMPEKHGLALGKLAAKRYRKELKKDPPVTEQFVGGATRMVKCYNLEEHPWLEEVVRDFIGQQQLAGVS